ncbi:MAG: hypothetical protein HQ557_04395 [Bacteroidetes bacterium]|nr:hypothetical protein [Bacteroidota bacterium]
MHGNRKEIEAKLKNWWDNGDQKTPCFLYNSVSPDFKEVHTDTLKQYWTDMDLRIDRSLRMNARTTYLGQATPFHWLDYMASTMCVVLGCEAQYVDTEGVWTNPRFSSVEEVEDVQLDFTNEHYQILREMNKRLALRVPADEPIAFFALEGITDIVSGLYGVEEFLMDMILKPQEVKGAMKHIKRIWIDAFHDFKQIIYKNRNPESGIGWAGIWSPGTTFPMQEDLTYMISTDMYKEFCVPHVTDIASVLDYPLYHLDGIGAIPHLDALLQIDEIKAIQWVPGAGKEPIAQWYELIEKIVNKGKSIQVFAKPEEVDDLVKHVGSNRLLVTVTDAEISEAEALLERYKD